MATLIVRTAQEDERRVDLVSPETSIGRSGDAQVTLRDDSVSGMHCAVVRTGSRYTLRDLNSTNGTYLNEAPVTETPLQDGDVIELGDTVITFEEGQGDEELAEAQLTRRVPVPGGPQAFGTRHDTRRTWTVIMIIAVLVVVGALAWYIARVLPD